jgi:serine/threonine protein kinase
VAILNGESLRINILSDKLKSLLNSMLSKEAAKRPNIDEVFSKLKELKDTDLPTPSPDSLSRYIKEARQSTSPSLTGDLVKTKETGKPTSSSLKGSLVNKKVGSAC